MVNSKSSSNRSHLCQGNLESTYSLGQVDKHWLTLRTPVYTTLNEVLDLTRHTYQDDQDDDEDDDGDDAEGDGDAGDLARLKRRDAADEVADLESTSRLNFSGLYNKPNCNYSKL